VTEQERSLWEAVFDHVAKGGVVTREEIFRRFRHDDELALRAVLRDLTDSGVVFASGSGRHAVYRLATEEEIGAIRRTGDRTALEAMIWSVVFRDGPMTLERRSSVSKLDASEIEPALSALVADGRLEIVSSGGRTEYRSQKMMLGLDDPTGWEASVLDHFSALVQTIGKKLSRDQRATARDEIGGSTYHFVVWRGHPFEAEVVGELRRFRDRSSGLRDRIDKYNESHGIPEDRMSVTAYYGQCVVEGEDNDATA